MARAGSADGLLFLAIRNGNPQARARNNIPPSTAGQDYFPTMSSCIPASTPMMTPLSSALTPTSDMAAAK